MKLFFRLDERDDEGAILVRAERMRRVGGHPDENARLHRDLLTLEDEGALALQDADSRLARGGMFGKFGARRHAEKRLHRVLRLAEPFA